MHINNFLIDFWSDEKNLDCIMQQSWEEKAYRF